MSTNDKVTSDALRDALTLFEKNLQTPIVSGEQTNWLKDTVDGFGKVEPMLRRNLNEQSERMKKVQEDSVELAGQIDSVRESAARISARLESIGAELNRLHEQSKAVQPDELKLSQPIQQMIDRNLAFIVEMRKMDTAMATLHQESQSDKPPKAHTETGVEKPPATGPNGVRLIDEPGRIKKDVVQEASEESFPASDPPSRTPITST